MLFINIPAKFLNHTQTTLRFDNTELWHYAGILEVLYTKYKHLKISQQYTIDLLAVEALLVVT
jgi:hypothetical protein